MANIEIAEIPSLEFGSVEDIPQASILAFSAIVNAYRLGGVILRNAFDAEDCAIRAQSIGEGGRNLPVRPIRNQAMPQPSLATHALFNTLAYFGAELSHTFAARFETDVVPRQPHKDVDSFPEYARWEERIRIMGFSVLSDLSHEATINLHEDSESMDMELWNQAPITATGSYRRGDGFLLRQRLPIKPASIHSALSITTPKDTQFGETRKLIIASHMADNPDHLAQFEALLAEAAQTDNYAMSH